MPRFSVIIPIYNAAETLLEALNSVLNQTCTDWEIVAVNDGSTDKSASIFKEATSALENVHLIEQQNAGLGFARNVAANQASGEWLVFLDADDYWSVNKLALLEKEISEQSEAEFIYHSVFELAGTGAMRVRKIHEVQNADEFVKLGNPFVPSAVSLKKDVFLAEGGFVEDRNQVEDLVFWLRLLKRKTKLIALKPALTVYRMGFGVTSNLEDHFQKVQRAINHAEMEGLVSSEQVEAFLNRKNYEAARQLQKQGHFKESLSYYKKHQGGGLKERALEQFCKWGVKI